MNVQDIKETPYTVFRVVKNGKIQGYTLTCDRNSGYGFQAMSEIDPNIDYVDQLLVHIFGTHREAEAFMEGLSAAGDEFYLSFADQLDDLWAVLHQIRHDPVSDGEPSIKVVRHSERPRLLLTVKGGEAAWACDDSDVQVLRCGLRQRRQGGAR